MSVKEMEILGHRSIDWDYSFEEFVCPPKVEENALILSVKDKSSAVFQKKENRGQEVQKRVLLQNSATAQEVLKALDEAWTACQQHTLVRQTSGRFINQFSN
ncbi:unnamed protein product [Staurois parvus]|uniref:Intermembrane lipid transfer protein VPS13-like C-terminal domain-containing protein n=1 Tax=Staurois parvus TaxID=386267 RepID=A0ABN9BPG7_9NEOB|nr:unnamed protein product [Staurois parvus]